MVTIEINKRTKASVAFLEYCRTLSFAKVKIDDENPSPSGDPWWNIPENRKAVERGIEDVKAGRVLSMTREELRMLLEV
jgi:hypothetical protein